MQSSRLALLLIICTLLLLQINSQFLIDAEHSFTASNSKKAQGDTPQQPTLITTSLKIDFFSNEHFKRPVEIKVEITGIDINTSTNKNKNWSPYIIINLDGDYSRELDLTSSPTSFTPHPNLHAPYYLIPLTIPTDYDGPKPPATSATLHIARGFFDTYQGLEPPVFNATFPNRHINVILPLNHLIYENTITFNTTMRYINPDDADVQYPVTSIMSTWNKGTSNYPIENTELPLYKTALTNVVHGEFKPLSNTRVIYPNYYSVQNISTRRRFAFPRNKSITCRLDTLYCHRECDNNQPVRHHDEDSRQRINDDCYNICNFVPATGYNYTTTINQYQLATTMSLNDTSRRVEIPHRWYCPESNVIAVDQRPIVYDFTKRIGQLWIDTNTVEKNELSTNWNKVEQNDVESVSQWIFRRGSSDNQNSNFITSYMELNTRVKKPFPRGYIALIVVLSVLVLALIIFVIVRLMLKGTKGFCCC